MTAKILVQTCPDTYFCGLVVGDTVFKTFNTPHVECATEFEDKETAKMFCDQMRGKILGTYAHPVEVAVEEMATAAQ